MERNQQTGITEEGELIDGADIIGLPLMLMNRA